MAQNPQQPERDGEAPWDYEVRSIEALELRAVDDAARRLEGYAVPFGTATKIRSWAGDFEETVEPGAFSETLRSGSDVRLLVEHDPRALLARTSARNLVLSEDQRGLHFRADLPDTQLGRDTYEQVRVRNYRGMSFGFRPVKTRTQYDGQGRLRSVALERVDLLEITVTSVPYYPKTSVAIRSLIQTPPGAAPGGDLSLRLRVLRIRG